MKMKYVSLLYQSFINNIYHLNNIPVNRFTSFYIHTNMYIEIGKDILTHTGT